MLFCFIISVRYYKKGPCLAPFYPQIQRFLLVYYFLGGELRLIFPSLPTEIFALQAVQDVAQPQGFCIFVLQYGQVIVTIINLLLF